MMVLVASIHESSRPTSGLKSLIEITDRSMPSEWNCFNYIIQKLIQINSETHFRQESINYTVHPGNPSVRYLLAGWVDGWLTAALTTRSHIPPAY